MKKGLPEIRKPFEYMEPVRGFEPPTSSLQVRIYRIQQALG
jgi:hypothetical protein